MYIKKKDPFTIAFTSKTVVKPSEIIITIFILLIFCQSVYQLIVGAFSGIAWYGIVVLSGIVMVNANGKLNKGKINAMFLEIIIWALLYIVFLQISAHTTIMILGCKIKLSALQILQNLLILIIASSLVKTSKYDNNICIVLFVSFFINAYFTLNALMLDNNVSKAMATGNVEKYTSVNTFGVIGYAYVYALLLFMPILLVLLVETNNKKIKVYLCILIAMIVSFIFSTSYMIANMLLLFSVILLVFFEMSGITKLILSPLLIILVANIFSPLSLGNLLNLLSSKINIINISERLSQMATFLITGQKGDTLARLDLYARSIENFMRHPILGNGLLETDFLVSGHADLLDMLAYGGLIITIPFLYFLFSSYKKLEKQVKTNKQKQAIKTTYILYILLNCINSTLSSVAILFTLIGILPVLLRVGNKIKEKNNVENIMAL